MKTTGANWKAYLASWPQGQWFDDSDETINGEDWQELDARAPKGKDYLDLTPDDAVVEFTSGVVYPTEESKDGVSLITHFRRWLKSRDTAVVIASVPRAGLDAFRAYCKANKITIKE